MRSLAGRPVQTDLGKGSAFTLCIPMTIATAEEILLHAEDESRAVVAIAGADAAQVSSLLSSLKRSKPDSGGGSPTDLRTPKILKPVSPSYRLLAADDHPLNLHLVRRLLTLNGFVVMAVGDGQQALDALKASYAPGGAPFHIVLLDMQARPCLRRCDAGAALQLTTHTQMPIMSGPECSAAFRVWEKQQGLDVAFGRLPIVALSANVLEARSCHSCFGSS